MCDGCTHWHGDYHRDILGRSVEEIERDIRLQEKTIVIREYYKAANEGYPQRTAALKRSVELDREILAEVKRRIAEHEPRQTSVRGSRSSKSPVKNGRRNR